MTNRSGHTYNRTTARVRLWLKHATWDALEAAANELGWDRRAPSVIERVLDEWALAQLERASRDARRYDQRDGTTTQDELAALAAATRSTGPVELGPDPHPEEDTPYALGIDQDDAK